jgi:sodium-type flagellar protein MotY
MKIFYFFILAYLFIFPAESISAQREYRSHIESADWETKAEEKRFCLIKQKIPYYGEVIFTRKSGQEMLFELTSEELFLKQTQVIIMAEPAPWRQNVQSFEIGSFTLTQGHKPLTAQSPYASRMFQHIENGMMPTITYRDVADKRDLISIAISPMQFRKHLKKFRQCESTLLEYDPELIKDFDLFFATNKSILTDRAKKFLSYVVKHLKVETDIQQIRIDAHADNIGRRRFNDRLSEKRAEAVKNYLIKVGADKNLIYTKAHGEREPQHPNDTKKGRAKNRHARIQMLKTAPPIETGKEEEKAEDKKNIQPTEGITPPIPNFINLEHLITR